MSDEQGWSLKFSMYPDSWEQDDIIRPILRKEDIAFLLENTDFDEYDIREWFREFLKVMNVFTPQTLLCKSKS